MVTVSDRHACTCHGAEEARPRSGEPRRVLRLELILLCDLNGSLADFAVEVNQAGQVLGGWRLRQHRNSGGDQPQDQLRCHSTRGGDDDIVVWSITKKSSRIRSRRHAPVRRDLCRR